MALDSEDKFLELIDRHFLLEEKGLLGRGDDCVQIEGGELCVTADLFLEDRHFRHSYFSPADIGYKGLAVNVSDIAACGAEPAGFVLSLMIPDGLPDSFWDFFFSGMAELANKYRLPLLGGDLSASDSLGLNVTIWGRPGPSGRFLARGGCKPGDLLFICGEVGLARGGLLALEAIGEKAKQKYPTATKAHLRPTPRVKEGLILAGNKCKGLMDLSDGLARDLPRFLGPNMGIELEISKDMAHAELISLASDMNIDPVETMILGGEDYALLGCCASGELRNLQARIPGLRAIGRVVGKAGIKLNGIPYTHPGFDHFSK